MASRVEFRVLGSVEVLVDGEPVPVGARKQRAVLAALLLRANEVVPAGALVEELWAGRPPRSAAANVRTYLTGIRGALPPAEPERLVSRPTGHLLRATDGELDALRFVGLAAAGRSALAAGDATAAVATFDRALRLWNGGVAEDVPAGPVTEPLRRALTEQRMAAWEGLVRARLALGDTVQLAAELRALVTADPLRESAWGLLMTVLHRAGDSAGALRAYTQARTALVDSLGVEPGDELRRQQRQILEGRPEPPRRAANRATGGPPWTVVRQLPRITGPLIGRDGEIAELDRLAGARPALVAICGTAGVGKTTLAVHWARTAGVGFPDGQLHVDLRGYGPGEPAGPGAVLDTLLRAVGTPPQRIPTDPDERAVLWRDVLADRRVLVVLDNARDSDQVRPLLTASAGLTLVTSRSQLRGLVARDGARRLLLDRLAPDAAAALLTQPLGAGAAPPVEGPVAELVELCARLPLALRIAAERVTRRPAGGLDELVAEIRARQAALDALSAGDDLATDLRAVFSWSVDQLDTASARMFRLLGAAPGDDIGLAGAAALAGLPERAARTGLDRLVSVHLVEERHVDRYGMHDLLRGYAAELAGRCDPEPVRTAATGRLLEHYVHRADAAARAVHPTALRLPEPATGDAAAAFDDADQAMAWLDSERANLVAAVRLAAEQGPGAVAWGLADALRMYYYLRLHAHDWEVVAKAGLAAAVAAGNGRAEAAVEISLALLRMRQGRPEQAIEHHYRALGLARRASWPAAEAVTHNNLGLAYAHAGRLPEAGEHFTAALALFRRIGPPSAQAPALGNLSSLYLELGRLDEAVDLAGQAVELYRAGGNVIGEALALSELGQGEHAAGRAVAARDHLARALRGHREVGNRMNEAETMLRLAAVLHDLGEDLEAHRLARSAHVTARELGYRRGEAATLNVLAAIHARRGRPATAADLYGRALQLNRPDDNRYVHVQSLLGLAAANQHRHRYDQAVELAQQARTIASRAGYRLLVDEAAARLEALRDPVLTSSP